MYKPVQKKSLSWTPALSQSKSKSLTKPGTFSVQPKSERKSSQQQEIPSYSTIAADALAANVMRSLETQQQEQEEAKVVQRQLNLGAAFVADGVTSIAPSPSIQSKEAGIQRQCSECAKEQQEQSDEEGKDSDEMSVGASGIQTKLTVGAPGDKYEQEADQVAAQVMSMSLTPDSSPQVQRFGEEENPVQRWSLAQSITPVVQMQVDEQVQMRELVQRAFQAGGNEASGDLESRLNASKGGGSALSEDVRSFMEPRFGADFSGVRVHTGSEAVQMNRELGAQAFAHGSDVYFGAGKSPGNNELTAHELTHVVQQNPASALGAQAFTHKQDVYFGAGKAPAKDALTAHELTHVVQQTGDRVQRAPGQTWIGERINWVRAATHADNWANADPPGAYYILNGLSMDDMVRVLRALTPADRKKLSENLDENGAGFDRARIQLALTNAETGSKDKWWQDLSEKVHWAIRSNKFVEYPDGAFWIINPLNENDSKRIMKFLNRDSLDELIANGKSAVEAGVPNAQRILRDANQARGSVKSTKNEQYLIDLIDGNDWKNFFAKFNELNEADKLRFLRNSFGAVAKISNNIDKASGISNQDYLHHLIEKVTNDASTNLYVDAMVKTYSWQPKYRVNDPKEFSRIIRFGNTFDVEIDINSIDDGQMSDEEADKQFREAKPGPGGFLWPAVRNRSTLPILWQVKQDVHKQMETLLFDDVLAAGIEVVVYLLTVVLPEAQSGAMRSLKELSRGSLSTRWMKGAQVIKGRVPPEIRARELVKQMTKEGNPIIANIGGAGASHEPANAININNQAVARKNIPNLVEADGSRIGELFDPGTVDRIEGHNMAPGAINWSRTAPGAKTVLKSGGKVKYYYRGANLDAKIAEQELKKAGFTDVQNLADVVITATKP